MSAVLITKENVKKAYESGSSEVKKVLKDLMPEVFREEWVKMELSDIEVKVDNERHSRAGFDIHLTDKKTRADIAYVWNGIVHPQNKSMFRVEKSKESHREEDENCFGFVVYRKEK